MTRDEMFAYALSQPGAEDSMLHGGRCIRVRGHWIVTESSSAKGEIALALDHGDVDFLMETEPQTYFQTPHFHGYPAVLVRPEPADDARLRDQIDKAWARRATKAQRIARGM
jgi:hypothetical protein